MTQLFHIETARALYSIGQEYRDIPGVSEALEDFAPWLEREVLTVHPKHPCTNLVIVIASGLDRSEVTRFFEKVALEIVNYLPIASDGTSENLLKALQHFQQWLSPEVDSRRFEIAEEADTIITYAFDPNKEKTSADLGQHSLVSELFLIAVTCAFLRKISNRTDFVKQVHLQHSDRSDLANLLGLAETQVFISQERTKLVLDSSYLKMPFKHARTKSDKTALPINRQSFEKEIELGIEPYIGFASVSAVDVSKIFAIPKRTIQHRLKQEGVSLKAIIERLSVKFFDQRYGSGKFEIEDLAAHLGYSNASSFIRMYKKVTGTTPARGRH